MRRCVQELISNLNRREEIAATTLLRKSQQVLVFSFSFASEMCSIMIFSMIFSGFVTSGIRSRFRLQICSKRFNLGNPLRSFELRIANAWCPQVPAWRLIFYRNMDWDFVWSFRTSWELPICFAASRSIIIRPKELEHMFLIQIDIWFHASSLFLFCQFSSDDHWSLNFNTCWICKMFVVEFPKNKVRNQLWLDRCVKVFLISPGFPPENVWSRDGSHEAFCMSIEHLFMFFLL